MHIISRWLSFLCLIWPLALLGCGGGGSGSNPGNNSTSTTGAAVFLIHWPAPTRLIPVATAAITITLSANNQQFAQRTISNPGNGQDTTTTFPNLPPGALQVNALAIPPLGPNQSPNGAVLATASLSLTITAGKTTQTTLSLNSTIHTIAVTPPNPYATLGISQTLIASAQDSKGASIFSPPKNWKWTNDAPSVVKITYGGDTATVTGLALGTAHITATETESGISSQVTLQVTATSVVVSPATLTLAPHVAGFFTAQVQTDVTNTAFDSKAVIWSVQEGSVGGTISPNGIYTPTAPGTYHIVATSVLTSTAKSLATVTVIAVPRNYSITDLGVITNANPPTNLTIFNGEASLGLALNAGGQVTSQALSTGGSPGAFRTAPGGPISSPGTDLGLLPGGTYSMGMGTNAGGQVVGGADTGQQGLATGHYLLHAFRSTPNGVVPPVLTDLGMLPGGVQSIATAINAGGQVVGMTYYTGSINFLASHAYRLAPGGLLSDPGVDLNPPSSYSEAYDINASGQVVGIVRSTDLTSLNAYRTTPTGGIDDAAKLGTLPLKQAVSSAAYGINDSGQVTGSSGFHAFRTTATGNLKDGTATDLGVLSDGSLSNVSSGISVGLKINNHGDVVGFSFFGLATHAFLYQNYLVDLNDAIPANSGWVLSKAIGINDAGQIAGVGTLNGETHAFLLTPH